MVYNLNHTITATLSSPIGTGDFTIECWAMAGSNIGSDNGIWGLHETTAYAAGYINGGFMTRDAGGFYYVLGSATANTGTSPAFLLNVWYHTAIVRQSGVSKFYINGKLINTAADTVNRTNVYLLLGGYYSARLIWDGYIADFRITSNAVYTTEFTPPSEPLETIAGTLVHINSQPAIIDASQSTALTLVDTTKSSTTQIKYGNSSMYFDGAGRLDLITPVPSFGTGDFTVEAWVYQITENTYSSLCEIGNHLTVNGIIFITTSTGNATIYSGAFYGSRPFPLGQWNHIAFVRSSGNLLIFVNGSAGSPVTFTNNLTDNSVVNVGGRSAEPSSGYLLNGYVQDFRVTKGLARYTTNFTPPAALLEG